MPKVIPSHKSQFTRVRDLVIAHFAARWYVVSALALVLVLAVAWLILRSATGTAIESSDVPSQARESSAVNIVTLDSAAQRLAGIEVEVVAARPDGDLVANSLITYNANRVAAVSSRVEARISAVRADLGHEIKAGGLLAVLESSEIGQTRGDLERSRSSLDAARKNYEREKRLFAEQITPQKEMLEAEAAFRSAEADYRSAIARLAAVGASQGRGATFNLVSPISGTVVERNASPGQSVGPYNVLFTIADIRNVWLTADVYESDLQRIRQGARVDVLPSAFRGETFDGRVTFAGGVVDTASHTFKVRIEVPNPGLRLRPGMFAEVRIETPAVSGSATVRIPESAVQDLNGRQVVFVADATPGRYVVREVVVTQRIGNATVVISRGLKDGERIVTKGTFQLKAELAKEAGGQERTGAIE